MDQAGHLRFVRSQSTIDCWDAYEERTQVLVFGDGGGFTWLASSLDSLDEQSCSIKLPLLLDAPLSMPVVILPPIPDRSEKPKLKCIERLIREDVHPTMELVIGGNAAGLGRLAEAIQGLVDAPSGNPHEHVDFDDYYEGSILVPRSVSLSIRGPFSEWSSDGFGDYKDLLSESSNSSLLLPNTLPKIRLESLTEYDEISFRESDFLSLGMLTGSEETKDRGPRHIG